MSDQDLAMFAVDALITFNVIVLGVSLYFAFAKHKAI